MRWLYSICIISTVSMTLSGCSSSAKNWAEDRAILPYSDQVAPVSLPVPIPAPRNGPDIENGTVTASSRPAHEKLTSSGVQKMVSDNRLRTDILASIADDPAIDPFQFRYVVEDGKVEIRGQGSERQRKRVTETVGRVRGVRGVENAVLTPEEARERLNKLHPVSDEELERDIQDAIERDPQIEFSRIEIRVQEGVVALMGYVPNLRTSFEMERVAREARGVQKVINRLQVKTRYTRSDERLARDVKAALSLEPLLHSENLKVVAHRGEVTISGEVSAPWKRARALELGSEVFGVVAIQNDLHVAELPALN